jgi:hypothetical protein
MTTLGFDNPLYILPFDHRGSLEKDVRMGRSAERGPNNRRSPLPSG